MPTELDTKALLAARNVVKSHDIATLDYALEVGIAAYLRAIAKMAASALPPSPPSVVTEALETYFARQIEWSRETFGPALRTKGILDHIRKELREVEAEPHDLSEWVDLIILSMDGFWRHGGTASDLMPRLLAKQKKNMARTWPDWRTMSEDQAIEHDRSGEAAPPPPSVVTEAMPERDQTRPSERQGLFRKFNVRRTDGSDAPGGKHYGCRYFVLDVDHDPHALAGLSAYAAACKSTHPDLANDLREKWGAALSAPTEGGEAKPVAWLGEGAGFKSFTRSKVTAEKWRCDDIKVTPVYIHPASKAVLGEAGWRDMDSAPKDVDILVGGIVDGIWKSHVYRIRDEFWREDWEDEPTHWMPVPAAPVLTKIREV